MSIALFVGASERELDDSTPRQALERAQRALGVTWRRLRALHHFGTLVPEELIALARTHRLATRSSPLGRWTIISVLPSGWPTLR